MENKAVAQYPPRVGTSGVGVYPLSREQLREVMSDLWNETLVEKLFSVNANPMDNIMSIRWYYGLGQHIPRVDTPSFITMGNVVFDGLISESSIKTRPASTEFVELQVININRERTHHNFLDFSPYSEYDLFLPYYGFYKIDGADIIRGDSIKVYANYKINLITGSTVITIIRNNNTVDKAAVIATLQCTVGTEIPVNIQSVESLASRSVSLAAKAVGIGATITAVTAVPALAPSVATSAITSYTPPEPMIGPQLPKTVDYSQQYSISEMDNPGVTQSAINTIGNSMSGFSNSGVTPMTRSAGLDGETGILGPMRGFLNIKTSVFGLSSNDMKSFTDTFGRLSGATPITNNIKNRGFFKVSGMSPSRRHSLPFGVISEIENLLRSGVFGNDKEIN